MRLEISLEPKLEQRLDIRQEIKLELKQYIPSEFLPFIDLDNDDDYELLKDSLPFLSLHELSHVLQHKNMLSIVRVQDYASKTKDIANNSQESEYAILHDLIETSIDKAAFVVGQEACKYQYEELAASHCALIQRVYRDCVERSKVQIGTSFMARALAGIRFYKTLDLSARTKAQVDDIEQKLEKFGKNIDNWEKLVEMYQYTFRESTTSNGETYSGPAQANKEAFEFIH